MDATRYTIPAESRRWRALVLAAGLHAMLLGALWLGARGHGEAPVALKAEQSAARTEAVAAVREIAKPPVVTAPAMKPAALRQRQEKNRLPEQKKRSDNARAAELKRKENQKRIELARREALAQQAKLKQEKRKSEALARKVAADAAKKAAAEASLRDKLRKDEMRRIAGGLA